MSATLTAQLLEKSYYYDLRSKRRDAHANAMEGRPYDRMLNLDETTRWRSTEDFRHYAERDRIRVKHMQANPSVYPIFGDDEGLQDQWENPDLCNDALSLKRYIYMGRDNKPANIAARLAGANM